MKRPDRAQVLAKTTLALLSERGLPPTPENYQLFYVFVAGENPALSQALSERIAGNEQLAPRQLEDLRDRYLGTQKIENCVHKISAEFTDKVGTVLAKLADVEKDTKAYGRTLNAASGELTGDLSPAAIENLIKTLVGATRAMETRTKTLEKELQRSSREVVDLRAKLDDVRRETLTDPLTGIANRKALDLELSRAIEQALDQNEPLCLCMCDIDHFKAFNDTWGHQTGDQVLRLVGGCLSENVKGRDTAARYGGEEFMVILPQTEMASALKLANSIRSNVESKKLVKRSTGDILGRLTISIGVAELAPGDSPSDLVRRADACLYAAKNAGRNCVVGEGGLVADATQAVVAA